MADVDAVLVLTSAAARRLRRSSTVDSELQQACMLSVCLVAEATFAVALEEGPHPVLILVAKLLAVGALDDVADVMAPALQIMALVSIITGTLVEGGGRRGLVVVVVVVIPKVIAVGTVIEDLMDQPKRFHTLVFAGSACRIPAVEAVVAQICTEMMLIMEAFSAVLVENIPDVVDVFVAVLVALVPQRVHHEVRLADFLADVVRRAGVDAVVGQTQECGLCLFLEDLLRQLQLLCISHVLHTCEQHEQGGKHHACAFGTKPGQK
mmetsp:Transcript_75055/g.179167  ORF Transcript_75055/g.179167 Transcript_75055/m.179167 type:complete len:265 (+) Transcript_75055:295-1089(+)